MSGAWDRRQRAVEAVDEHLTAAATNLLGAQRVAFENLGRQDEVTRAVGEAIKALDAALGAVGRAQRHR